jgi:hypothetical protein
MLTDIIYYADEVQGILEAKFVEVGRAPWVTLYLYSDKGTYWRLDEPDKCIEQYFVQIDDLANWKNLDTTELEIQLLKRRRGYSLSQCSWQ